MVEDASTSCNLQNHTVTGCYTVYMFNDFSVAYFVTVLLTLLISLSVHEAVHAFTAYRLGDDTAAEEGRLTLNPLKHLDIYTTILLPAALMLFGQPPIFIAKPVPFDPERVRFGEYGSALVAVAGPISNFCLAAITAVLIRTGVIADGVMDIAFVFMWVNIGLFVFNMMPIPPLDGSRLLYAFAPAPLQRIMQQIEAMGLIVIVLIVLLLSPVIGPILFNMSTAVARLLLGG